MCDQKKEKVFALVALVLFLCAVAWHYMAEPWGFYRTVSPEEAASRMSLVRAAEKYLEANEADGSHRIIVDRYNTLEPLPVGYILNYEDSWCAAFVTVAAMEAGLTEYIPAECGCERQIALLDTLGCWQEWDNAVPQPGDMIYYDWDATRQGASLGWADHVGIVVGVKWPFLKIIEGNYGDAVAYRIIPVGHRHIRGYGLPKYGP